MTGAEPGEVPAALERSPEVCCAANCGKLGEFHVGGKIWMVGDDLCRQPPLQFETPMLACAEHREKMPSTCEAFLGMDFRQSLTEQCRALGKQPPNYRTAQWVFKPIAEPPKAGAN